MQNILLIVLHFENIQYSDGGYHMVQKVKIIFNSCLTRVYFMTKKNQNSNKYTLGICNLTTTFHFKIEVFHHIGEVYK